MNCKSRGFTLVELVVTLVLLGILGTFAMARFLPGDTFNATVTRDQILALARSAQQYAIGRTGVVLTVQPSGDDVLIAVADSSGTLQSATVPLQGGSLRGDVNEVASCAEQPGEHALSASSPLQLAYTWPGRLGQGGVAGSAGFPHTIVTGARICLDNNPAASLCISASGYAHPGNCDA